MTQKSGATVSFGGFISKGATLNAAGSAQVANFRVQVGRGEGAETFDCALWGKRGEALAAYLKQRMPVSVTGQLGRSEYEGTVTLTCTVAEIALLSNVETLEREREHYFAKKAAQEAETPNSSTTPASKPKRPRKPRGKPRKPTGRNVIAEGAHPDDVIEGKSGGQDND
ncbi:single-stranded DNA-binding protein [Ruegeria sp. Alg231-54]|uniref:single-stranded DNA-binding protein n=1 Tax=Ruegeria sp. Alg231-54 TaxID=1922221 RepID=UPI000D55B9DC|nr:single-stranded DNA-binding protein [Ruegeria sp. Alg231-54]